MEFNPRKLGQKNVERLIDWYNSTIAHSTFSDIASVPHCITRLDLAVDIVGAHISDLVLNRNDGKSNQWHSAKGLLETYYFGARAGKSSKIKAYNKKEQAISTGEIEEEHYPYGRKNVTRVAVSLNEIKLAINDLYKLINHFKHVKIYSPMDLSYGYFQGFMPEGEEHFRLALDSVRLRGEAEALEQLPAKTSKNYKELLRRGMRNILDLYSLTENWRCYWQDGLEASGLLYDFRGRKWLENFHQAQLSDIDEIE